jgi:hypothetical protein
MGMFDTILVNQPLPLTKKDLETFSNINWEEEDFQTKCTDCTLSTYVIKKNALYSEIVDGEHVRTISKEEEKKIKKQGKFCWPYKFVEKSRKSVLQKFNGEIIFYTSLTDKDGNEWWVDFSAKFVNGKLKGKIKKVLLEMRRTSKQIKRQDQEWEAKIEAEQKKIHNRIRVFMNKITFNNWRYIWWSISKGLHRLNGIIVKVEMFINRNIA